MDANRQRNWQHYGPVLDDLGSGINAWFIEHNSTVNGSFTTYEKCHRQRLLVGQGLSAGRLRLTCVCPTMEFVSRDPGDVASLITGTKISRNKNDRMYIEHGDMLTLLSGLAA